MRRGEDLTSTHVRTHIHSTHTHSRTVRDGQEKGDMEGDLSRDPIARQVKGQTDPQKSDKRQPDRDVQTNGPQPDSRS